MRLNLYPTAKIKQNQTITSLYIPRTSLSLKVTIAFRFFPRTIGVEIAIRTPTGHKVAIKQLSRFVNEIGKVSIQL